MDTIPELRISTLKYLPQTTLEQILVIFNESCSNRKNKTKSPYTHIFASLKDRFYQLFGRISLNLLKEEVNRRVNNALVFILLLSDL